MHERMDRLSENDIGKKYKVRFKKIPFSDVKKVVQEIREKREKDKYDKMMMQNEEYIRKMKFIQKTHDRLRQEKLKKIVEERKILHSKGIVDPDKVSSQDMRANQGAKSSLSQAMSNPFSYLEIKNTKQGAPID